MTISDRLSYRPFRACVGRIPASDPSNQSLYALLTDASRHDDVSEARPYSGERKAQALPWPGSPVPRLPASALVPPCRRSAVGWTATGQAVASLRRRTGPVVALGRTNRRGPTVRPGYRVGAGRRPTLRFSPGNATKGNHNDRTEHGPRPAR